MKKFLFVAIVIVSLGLADLTDAAINKDGAAVDVWAVVAQNTVREGAEVDISTFYAASLHIDIAVTSATLHAGTMVKVQVNSNTSGDEDWTDYYQFVGPTGTANPEALSGAEAIGQTVLEVASTVGEYDEDETRWIFLLDDDADTESEMLFLVSHVGNTSVTVQDALVRAHDANDDLYDIAKNYPIVIPPEFSRVRVIYDNTFDSDGSQIHCKTRISYMDSI